MFPLLTAGLHNVLSLPFYKPAQLREELLNDSDKTLVGFVIGEFIVSTVCLYGCEEGA